MPPRPASTGQEWQTGTQRREPRGLSCGLDRKRPLALRTVVLTRTSVVALAWRLCAAILLCLSAVACQAASSKFKDVPSVDADECLAQDDTALELVEKFVDIQRGVLPLGRALSRGNVLPIMSAPQGISHWVVSSTKDLRARWFHDPHQVTFYGFRCTHQPSPWIGDYGQFLVAPEVEGLKNPIYSLHKSTYKPYLFRGNLINYCSREGCAEVVFAPSKLGALLETRFPANLHGARAINVLINEGEINIVKDEGSDVGGAVRIEGFSASYKKGVADEDIKLTRAGLHAQSNFRNYFSVVLDLNENPQVSGVSTKVNCGEGFCVATIAWSPQNVNIAQTALLRIGTSFVSVEQARFNADRELAPFAGAEHLAKDVAMRWNALLSRVQVETDSMANVTESKSEMQMPASPWNDLELKTQLYTCMYRALLFPRLIAEEQRDGSIVHMSPYTRPAALRPGPVATDSGFWDAYRAVYPFLHLVFPEIARQVLRGWINAFRDLGRVPQWPSPGSRNEMVSTMGDVVLAEAIVNDALDSEDADTAFAALLRNAYEPLDRDGGGAANSRGEQLTQFATRGFVPRLVSETLDMALCDYAIGQAAAHRGRTDIQQDLARRAGNWRHIFDPKTLFFRPKHANGSFVEPFHEFAWDHAYTEGGPWQYRFSVPHDPGGLAAAYGGRDVLCSKLQEAVTGVPTFHLPDVVHEATEMSAHCFGQYAHNNQPVHHMLYMFAHAGATCAREGQAWIQHALQTTYGPFGYAGDEDNGEMSSWYLLSTLGLFALAPGSGHYQVGAPSVFRKIIVHRGNTDSEPLIISREHHLRTSNVTGRPLRVADAVQWRGATHSLANGPVNLSFQELSRGGELKFIRVVQGQRGQSILEQGQIE
ncbi:Alpha-1,2-mannosidase, putative [Hondaea fermentalgiana]|uniref:Alpha-1,2-mannosidase, putative n=1 Tax=Hondaea fermentalgiana TaxID=2315210 RepID=A0A2R5G305_9STRA|nr:Alpha-1,2-mannosidase, putative [Hondaea fermentalgiana]|eukprot:GBG25392.1 Alpha-1,2-mannosidase, putative [Hondaea fermentalgiana]